MLETLSLIIVFIDSSSAVIVSCSVSSLFILISNNFSLDEISALSDSYYPKGVTIGDNLEKLSLLQKIQYDLMAITQRNLMFFDTDEEFADFVIQPYAVFSENNGQLSYGGAYSEQYLRAVNEGKQFVIMKGSFESAVNRRKVVSKRVLVPEKLGSSRKDVYVSLTVENLSDGFIDL